jgi:GR25 family glycosyltransferase involved in LPS biosynthesis
MELFQSKKNIAIFSSLTYHYEMFGYIIQFCYANDYNLTIFSDNSTNNGNGWLGYYKELFSSFEFETKHYNFFKQEKYLFDLIFLTSNTDKLYFEYFDTDYLKKNTICITHQVNYLYKVQEPDTIKTIYVRPFKSNSTDKWFLPCFNSENKSVKIVDDNFINIGIIGACVEYDVNNKLIYYNYNTTIINRLKTDKKIKLHVISRNITTFQFYGLNRHIELHTYENVSTEYMFEILNKCSFIITDVNCCDSSTHEINRMCDINKHISGKNVGPSAPEDYHFRYEKEKMSGAISMAFSLCIPLIISKQTNQYYKFENVIEFDKTTDEDIILTDISFELIKNERNELNCKFNDFANISLKEIVDNQSYKMTHKKNYKIFYINIDERTDRKDTFEKHMKKYDLEFERFSAIKDNFGAFGCAKSHLSVLKNAKNNNLENVIIMEDDIAFDISPEMLDEKLKLIFDNELDFDVFHLSYRYRISEDVPGVDNLKKLSYCHYCSCYIINKKCYDDIIECWEKSLLLLSPENLDLYMHQKTERFSCDISYIPLLRKKKWYCFNKPVCVQLNGQSNITNHYINHHIYDSIEHNWADIDPSLLYINSLQ